MSLVNAQGYIRSTPGIVDTCMENSALTASDFNAWVRPDESSFNYALYSTNTFEGNVTFHFIVTLEGQNIFNYTIDPCIDGGGGFCPAVPGQDVVSVDKTVTDGSLDIVPVEDFAELPVDTNIQLQMINADTGAMVGCVLASELVVDDLGSTSIIDGDSKTTEDYIEESLACGSSNCNTTEAATATSSSSPASIVSNTPSSSNTQRELYSDGTTWETCMDNSLLIPDTFAASIYPDSHQIIWDFLGTNTFTGTGVLSLIVGLDSEVVYNYTAIACLEGAYQYLCPSIPGQLGVQNFQNIPADEFPEIPDSVYTEPNPDAYFQLQVVDGNTGKMVACLLTNVTNNAAAVSDATASEEEDEETVAASNSTGGSGNTSEASTAYLNWTVLA
jgi:hypothetical protein